MSGIEVAGVLLGAFPLIISGIEHCHNVAKVGGYFWQVRKEFNRCRSNLNYNEILYKRNLKALLVPIVTEPDDVALLIADVGGARWKDPKLQERLEARLQDSCDVYMDIIKDINETVEDMKRELCFDKSTVQDQLALPENKKERQPSPNRSKSLIVKSKYDYSKFRIKFSVRDVNREELFARLKECNERLEKLLRTSDQVSALQEAPPSTSKQISILETAFKKTYRQSELLFKALRKSFNCSCQQYHFANLRLEHRTLPEICFEIILMFVAPRQETTSWSWQELQCGRMSGCLVHRSHTNTTQIQPARPQVANGKGNTLPPAPTPKMKKVAFSTVIPAVPKIEVDLVDVRSMELCRLLGDSECSNCMGVIGHDDDVYHLHPFRKRKQCGGESGRTLGYILSRDFEGSLSRRQRYAIALLVASSVAQLQFTPWLRTGLTKEDVLFFSSGGDDNITFTEPFIRQGFSISSPASSCETSECNFYSLGILLLELCFGKPLEDHPIRRKHPAGDGDSKQAFDLMAALQWSRSVCDEGGEDYAAAVRWCFMGTGNTSKGWQMEMIRTVIRPLEICQEHFRTASTV
ncbi:hypothetical protein P280DRAFT_466398 [Massarina eburnea CBS 473.64]|uniref:DUF7580 domain-containing protein n=1 Tax=Massarina eburnea CBS 473.64 TaxID=1395130 RepID=A0A6A6S7R1_9PLEO|nr:hypothetical protein P280DRAFT_466398 [Massarina eburnea CBS 473.64]